MSSLIANKVKPNTCLVSVELFIVCAILCATVQTFTMYTNTITTTIIASLLFFSAYNFFASNNTFSLDLYSGDVQTTNTLCRKCADIPNL